MEWRIYIDVCASASMCVPGYMYINGIYGRARQAMAPIIGAPHTSVANK